MTIVLDHLVIRCRDSQRSAAFLARLLGLAVGESAGPFLPVAINAELTFDFDDRFDFAAGHYAFQLDQPEFDALQHRLQASEVPYGSGPERGYDRQVARAAGCCRVYVLDPDGHSYEFITART